MNPMDITIGIILVFACWFLYIAISRYDKNNIYNRYFFAAKSLTKDENAASYVARFTSLATVMAFFLVFAQFDGIFLLIAPLTVLIGVILFSKILEKANYVSNGTLPNELRSMYNSKTVGSVALVISGIALTVVLLIEIYLGVLLVGVFVSDVPGGLPIVVMFVSGIAVVYTGIGGLAAVIATDRIQAFLIYITVPCLIIALLMSIGVGNMTFMPRSPIEITDSIFTSVVILPIPLLLNILTVNLLLLPSLLSSWQLLTSSPDLQSFTNGITKGGRSVLILWSFFIFLGIALGGSGSEIGSISDIFNLLRNSENVLISYVFFPLLFIGCFAALLSTADSAILPIAQSIYDSISNEKTETLNRTILSVILFCVWLSLVVLYVIVFNVFKFDFISILFAVFGLSVVMTPAIFFGILAPERAKSAGAHRVAIFSICLGFATSVGFVVWGKVSGENYLIQLGAPFGAIVSSIVLLPLIFKNEAAA